MSDLCFGKNFQVVLCLFSALLLQDTAFCAKKPTNASGSPSVQPPRAKPDTAPGSSTDSYNIRGFTKENGGRIAEDNVAGICIKKNEIILLGYDKKYTSEPLKDGETFSDINFFKKYPKLVSVEFTEIELPKERLENIQKFLPKNIKNIVIDSCKIESENIEQLADVIKKRKKIKNVTIRLIDNGTEALGRILSAIAELSNLTTLCLTFDKVTKELCQTISKIIKRSSKTLANVTLAWDSLDEQDAGGEKEAETKKDTDGEKEKEAEKETDGEKENEDKKKAEGKKDEEDKKESDGEKETEAEKEADGAKESAAYQLLAESIGKINEPKTFELSIMKIIDEKSTTDLFSGIAKLTKLSTFKLFLGNISVQNRVELFANAETLGNSLKEMTQLVALDISGMMLPKDVMQVLAQDLKNLEKLKSLDLSGNAITPECAEALAESLKGKGLITLAVNGCELTASTFSTLCKALDNSPLTILYASNNAIKEGIKSLPVKTMTNLKVVDFSKNEIAFDNTMELIKLTAEHPNLQCICFGNNAPLDENAQSKRDDLENWKRENKCHTAFLGL
ncbi:hypothetical protein FACS189472_00080 [Alphaproteobacteria bacterium]|nr:hypothetical protein FACS189472_00080 [Alphaproteobacteria bacterium]